MDNLMIGRMIFAPCPAHTHNFKKYAKRPGIFDFLPDFRE
jgi:hypothetical protein